jgi:hypothetical protein
MSGFRRALGIRLGRAHSLIRIRIPGDLLQKLHGHTHQTSLNASRCVVSELISSEEDSAPTDLTVINSRFVKLRARNIRTDVPSSVSGDKGA